MKFKLLIVIPVIFAYIIGFLSHKAITTIPPSLPASEAEQITTTIPPSLPASESKQISDEMVCVIGSVLTEMMPKLVLDVSLSKCDSIHMGAIKSAVSAARNKKMGRNEQIDSLIFFVAAMRIQTLYNYGYNFGHKRAFLNTLSGFFPFDYGSAVAFRFAEIYYYYARAILETNSSLIAEDCNNARAYYKEYLERDGTKALPDLEEKCKGL